MAEPVKSLSFTSIKSFISRLEDEIQEKPSIFMCSPDTGDRKIDGDFIFEQLYK